MCYILWFHQYIWHFISLQEFEKKIIYQSLFFWSRHISQPLTFKEFQRNSNTCQSNIAYPLIAVSSTLRSMNSASFSTFCNKIPCVTLPAISPSSQVPLKTADFKALLKLLSSNVVLNSAVRLAGLRVFLFSTTGSCCSLLDHHVSSSINCLFHLWVVPQHKTMVPPFSLLQK